jgi:hypothetical protein
MEDAAMEQQDQGGMMGEERVKWDPQKVLKKTVTSSCWKFLYFMGSKDLACKKRVFCKLCPEGSLVQAQGIPYSGSTTNLTNHMQLKHKEAFNAEVIAEQNEKKKLDLNQNKLDAYFKPSKASPKWKKSSEKWKAVTKLIAKWFVKDTRPAGMVQDQGFVNLMGILAPEYDVPCQDTITKYIDTLYIEEHTKVLEELSGIDHCAVTSDGGAASNAMSFQNTNVHFIDEEMNLKHRTLAVKENKEKHTAVNYREKTNEILDEFGISEKVFMYVTDNENKMKAAFEKEERSGCISHIIHSSVSKAIDEVDKIKKVILKSRKISQKHNKSYAMRYGLEKAQKTIGIKLRPLQRDVENRWGSTRNSTESILDHEEDVKKRIGNPSALGDGLDEYHNARAINEALRGLKFTKKQKLSDFLLTGRDMARIKNLHKVLTKLDIYSTTLGGADFVSCSIVMPVVKSFQTVLKPDDDDPYYIDLLKRFILNDFKKRMQDNLNCKFLLTATCLDPRFKKLKVLEGKDARAEVYKQIEAEARVLKADAKRNDAKKDASNKVTGDKVVIVKKRKLGLLFEESSDEEEDDQDDQDILREVCFWFLVSLYIFCDNFFFRLSAIRLRQRSAGMRKTFWAGGERGRKNIPT